MFPRPSTIGERHERGEIKSRWDGSRSPRSGTTADWSLQRATERYDARLGDLAFVDEVLRLRAFAGTQVEALEELLRFLRPVQLGVDAAQAVEDQDRLGPFAGGD